MSPLEPGAALVDASVGQSDLTRAALINHTYRAGKASWTDRPSPLMVGVGWSQAGGGQMPAMYPEIARLLLARTRFISREDTAGAAPVRSRLVLRKGSDSR